MNNQQSRRGFTQAVAHKTKNNTYRLGVSPTEVASKNENVQRNARKLSGSHPTYKGSSAPSSSRSVSMRNIGAAHTLCPALQDCGVTKRVAHGFTARAVTPQGRYAGYSGRIGFTLIELLVVVLIIGILAAVAVPQYQKTALKAKWVSAFPQFKTLLHQQELIYWEMGSYPMGNDTTVSNHEIGTERNFSGWGFLRNAMCQGVAEGNICSYRHFGNKVIVIADLYYAKDTLPSNSQGKQVEGRRADCVTTRKYKYLCDAFCDTFGPCTTFKINP